MATGTKTKTPKRGKTEPKPGTHDWLRANDYVECGTTPASAKWNCGRLMKDLPAHIRDHVEKRIDENGKRVNRKPAEAAAFRFRFNGRDATKKFRGLNAEKRIALGTKLAKAAKKA